jgi:death-on-curing family protein
MATKQRTIKQLAQEANIDIDDALLSLWENGFDHIKTEGDKIGPRDLNRARRAIGIATRREFQSSVYWKKLLNLDDSKFQALLYELGVPLKRKTKLQTKAILRLKAEARGRGIDPITGGASQPSITDKADKLSDFKWRTPGHARRLRWLTVDEVRKIHYELVKDFSSTSDPINPPGVRSEHLLGSAVYRPQTAIGSDLKYPTVETSAAALLHSIILDHPFHNGNKRTALVSVLVFLDENGFFPEFDQDDVFKLLLQIAQHRVVDVFQSDLPDREVLAIADWFAGKCRVVEKGERPIPFRKLRQILVSYGCKVDPVITGKINIQHHWIEPSVWSIRSVFQKRKKNLQFQISYIGDGRDIPLSIIKKIRKELYLDELHGIDSHAFYNKETHTPLPDFIAHYRKTLDRLAKC